MTGNKEASIGCLMLVMLFLAVGFGLPVASQLIDSENLTTKVVAIVFLVIMLLLAVLFIPELMFVWFGIPILAILIAWIFFGDSSGACVPRIPGDCE
jgi:hypothetical protein